MTSIWNYCSTSDSSRAVEIGGMKFWFSYETCIAFSSKRTGFVIRENDWSKTTGKHLNAICRDHSIRIKSEDFERELTDCLENSYRDEGEFEEQETILIAN